MNRERVLLRFLGSCVLCMYVSNALQRVYMLCHVMPCYGLRRE